MLYIFRVRVRIRVRVRLVSPNVNYSHIMLCVYLGCCSYRTLATHHQEHNMLQSVQKYQPSNKNSDEVSAVLQYLRLVHSGMICFSSIHSLYTNRHLLFISYRSSEHTYHMLCILEPHQMLSNVYFPSPTACSIAGLIRVLFSYIMNANMYYWKVSSQIWILIL